MTKTEHYQLNQWDASDYVRREDFNEDNRKIEEALNSTLRFHTGSYVGTDQYGVDTPNQLTAPFPIQLVIIFPSTVSGAELSAMMLRNQDSYYASSNRAGLCQWENNIIKWYSKTDAAAQLNLSNRTYHYILIG